MGTRRDESKSLRDSGEIPLSELFGKTSSRVGGAENHGQVASKSGRSSHCKPNSQRPPNQALRTREYLTGAEVERLMEAAKGNRHGHRDATMVLVAYRHGYERRKQLTYAGTRSSSPPRLCTFVGPDRAPLARDARSWATSCGPYGGFSANSTQNRPSCSRRKGARHSPRLDSRG